MSAGQRFQHELVMQPMANNDSKGCRGAVQTALIGAIVGLIGGSFPFVLELPFTTDHEAQFWVGFAATMCGLGSATAGAVIGAVLGALVGPVAALTAFIIRGLIGGLIGAVGGFVAFFGIAEGHWTLENAFGAAASMWLLAVIAGTIVGVRTT
jgi:hypothetical protein